MLIRGEWSIAAMRGWETVRKGVRARSRRMEIDFILREVMYTSGLWRTVVLRMSVTGDCRGTVNSKTSCVPLINSFRMTVPESRLDSAANF